MRSKLIFTGVISLLFVSCVSVPRDGGLSDVNVLLKERANESVVADTEVSEADKKFIAENYPKAPKPKAPKLGIAAAAATPSPIPPPRQEYLVTFREVIQRFKR